MDKPGLVTFKDPAMRKPFAVPAQRQRGAARAGVIIVIVALLLVGWGLFSRQRASASLKQDTEQGIALAVETVQPKPSSEDIELVLPGNVQAQSEAPIYARTDGYLRRWLVDIGTPVKAGQVLAEIDAPELDQQLRAAEAELANVQANQKIAQVTAERWRDLRASDSVSQQEADEKIASAAASDAALQASRAQLQRLRELSGFKQIVAPFDGVITARSTDLGRLIGAGNSSGGELFRIADMRSLRLYVSVPQLYAAGIKPGVLAEVRFPDRPGLEVEAKVASTSGSLDAASRTLLTQLAVDNAQGLLLPGGYAEVHFKLPASSTTAALLVPANALLSRGQGLRVATVGADSKVAMKAVRLGRDLGTQIEIVDGLAASDQVIIAPPDSIGDGMQVRIVQPGADGKPAAKS